MSQCNIKNNSNKITDIDLFSVEKPAQYLGGEKNSIVKVESEVDAKICLAFPDTYEVGMSHLGLKILYKIINDDKAAWAERVFMPLRDMEEIHRNRSITLSSLESSRPLTDFDVLGFSLQYELCATNVLTCLLYTSPSPRDATLSRMPSSA